jgi:hypothetical protein
MLRGEVFHGGTLKLGKPWQDLRGWGGGGLQLRAFRLVRISVLGLLEHDADAFADYLVKERHLVVELRVQVEQFIQSGVLALVEHYVEAAWKELGLRLDDQVGSAVDGCWKDDGLRRLGVGRHTLMPFDAHHM